MPIALHCCRLMTHRAARVLAASQPNISHAAVTQHDTSAPVEQASAVDVEIIAALPKADTLHIATQTDDSWLDSSQRCDATTQAWGFGKRRMSEGETILDPSALTDAQQNDDDAEDESNSSDNASSSSSSAEAADQSLEASAGRAHSAHQASFGDDDEVDEPKPVKASWPRKPVKPVPFTLSKSNFTKRAPALRQMSRRALGVSLVALNGARQDSDKTNIDGDSSMLHIDPSDMSVHGATDQAGSSFMKMVRDAAAALPEPQVGDRGLPSNSLGGSNSSNGAVEAQARLNRLKEEMEVVGKVIGGLHARKQKQQKPASYYFSSQSAVTNEPKLVEAESEAPLTTPVLYSSFVNTFSIICTSSAKGNARLNLRLPSAQSLF